jgi:flagella basal body P-ring formation protein FlgA
MFAADRAIAHRVRFPIRTDVSGQTVEVIVMNNPRPVMSIRKTVQLMVILTLLAWATQTLFAQWGYSGLILPAPTTPTPGRVPAPAEMPATPPVYATPLPAVAPAPAPAPAPALAASPAAIQKRNGATVELRPRVRFVDAGRITLGDVCRWSDEDAAVMQPLAGTLIANLGGSVRVRQISVDDIKSRLHDAGANLSLLQFTGSAKCAILVGDATESELEPLPAVVVAEDGAAAPELAPTTQPQPEVERFFEEQLVLTRPLSRGQRIIASDLAAKRVEIDAPTTRPAIATDEIIGNVASRDLKKGDAVDAADFKPPAIVTRGQFITVAMRIGEFDVETVVRALDPAAKGETVRAKNESNGDIYRVVITGANEGRVEARLGEDVAALLQN